jgi:hypothetical protein
MYVTGVQWLNDMFNGVALLVAVSFAVTRQRAAGNRRLRRSDGTSGSSASPAKPSRAEELTTLVSERLAAETAGSPEGPHVTQVMPGCAVDAGILGR